MVMVTVMSGQSRPAAWLTANRAAAEGDANRPSLLEQVSMRLPWCVFRVIRGCERRLLAGA